MFSVGNFRKSALTPLQLLKNSCVFAFNADTAGWFGNNYAPEVGDGLLTRTNVSQSTGKVGQALNINSNISNIAQANATLNAYEPLFLNSAGNDLDYTISYWLMVNNSIETSYIFDNRVATPRSGYFNFINSGQLVAVEQSLESGSIRTLQTNFNLTGFTLNVFNHIIVKYNATTNSHVLKINNVNVTAASISNTGYTKKSMVANNLFIGSSLIATLPVRGSIDIFNAFKGLTIPEQDSILYNAGNGIQLFT